MAAPSLPFTRNWIDLDRVTNRVVRQVFEPPRAYVTASGASAHIMPIDLFATDEATYLLASLPGVRESDLDLSIHQNTVTISGRLLNAFNSEEAKGAIWFSRELWSGKFRRSFTLPFAIDADRVEAHLSDGILKVTLPRADYARPRKIAINGAANPSITATSNQDVSE